MLLYAALFLASFDRAERICNLISQPEKSTNGFSFTMLCIERGLAEKRRLYIYCL